MAATRLAGSVCLVTGATSGIGRAVAIALAERGAELLVSGRDERSLEEIATRTSGTPLATDLATEGAAAELATRALAARGHVDVLVSAAGAGLYGPVAELAPAEVERLVALNVVAPIELTSVLLPGMLERRHGHVVMVGSIAGRVGRGREATYAATKAAVSIFSDSLGAELAGSGVFVSLVTPGAVDTRFFARRGVPYDRVWPRPISAEAVAAKVVRALESGRAEVVVPPWLSVAMRLRGAFPGLYRALSRRFD